MTRRTALERASEGLRLFRGEILVDAGDWAAPHRARLEEVRLGLLEDVMAARVDLGSGGELVGELETLVTQHPLRERLWALAHDGVVPRGQTGRRTRGVRPGAEAAGRRARHRTGPGPARRSSSSSSSRAPRWAARPSVHPVTAPGNLPASLSALAGA